MPVAVVVAVIVAVITLLTPIEVGLAVVLTAFALGGFLLGIVIRTIRDNG